MTQPNRPAAAPSSNGYMLWFNEEGRARTMASNPGKPQAAIATICGGVWNLKTPEEKRPWEDKAKKTRAEALRREAKAILKEADALDPGGYCVIC